MVFIWFMKVKIYFAHGCQCGMTRGSAGAWADIYKGPCCITEWSTSHERTTSQSLSLSCRESYERHPYDLKQDIYLILAVFCSVLFWKWQVLRRQVFKLRNISIGWCSSARLKHVGLSGESVCMSPDNHWGEIVLKCFLGALVALQVLMFHDYWLKTEGHLNWLS